MQTGFSEIIPLETILESDVLLSPSINIEYTAQVPTEIVQMVSENTNGAITRGEKTLVRDLSVFPAGLGKSAHITFEDGKSLTVPLGNNVIDTLAGSSINIAAALGILWRKKCGIIGAVGRGAGRESVLWSLKTQGIAFFPLERDGGTAVSLFLREPDGTATAFSKKPPYVVPQQILDTASRANPEVLISSGFLPYELPLIEALWSAQGNRTRTRILSPHVACFKTAADRERCLKLASQADLLQVNKHEWECMLNLEDWEVSDDDQEAAAVLKRGNARTVCVTLAERGGITYDHESDTVFRQPAVPVSRIYNSVGAGDMHLACLIYYLFLRDRRVNLGPALELAARICAKKLEYEGPPTPWAGIPDSMMRKPWVREAEGRTVTR